MIDPSMEELMDNKVNPGIGSKFELVTMVAKRARQLNDGQEPLTDFESKKPVTIALHEINEGKILPIKRAF